ncbi:hypothetical protein Kfla_2537 [Kribbella flavida DSM 17836]|uniref:DUF2867 domain-containing protein n=1 Tax=Kribbella flavida (strain DSM 17836 / JCM 10339 / NBRC 14399) TaxID=479435 RepID=D2PWF6_KRIFD|nr:hypothetical protein [Kribbella flavida]ADB31608.1 hypothetical protein Kfla_2537 [Kribbella flavida DSM 17836]
MDASHTDGLPLVDEHARTINAARDAVWRGLYDHATGGLLLGPRNPLATVLGTTPRGGFEIVDSVDGESLTLAGRHHFSRYRLIFTLADAAAGGTVLTALTYAVFPGLHGRVYRALVIGSGAHVVATRGILRTIDQRCTALSR